MLNMLTYWAEA